MIDWKSVYEIRHVQSSDMETWHPYQGVGQYDIYAEQWELIYKSTGQMIARYRDFKYARKQARYRYRKSLKKIEKILFSGGQEESTDED